ncbi:MAG TPA: RdgB/HAM1 family non-canonical purine NTP pyrophosphatase [Bacteroidales bacterium]|nr:RdgB/HAM1 family non-canonical purine NTP pyrophosphatase [Bacteroidales bacterium]
MELIFASNNQHKIREIKSIIGTGFEISGLDEFNITEDIPENEATLEGNALAKARYVHRITGKNVFADDTGLETEALKGLPGVHSARFAGESKNSEANIEKLQMMLHGKTNRKARFRTVIALIWNDNEYLFEGVAEGEIIKDKRGTEGFGYDPVFVPEGRVKTFAEMNLEDKNRISHRAKAFEKLKSFLSLIAHDQQ